MNCFHSTGWSSSVDRSQDMLLKVCKRIATASLIECLNAHLNVTKKVLKGQTDVSRGVLDMNPTDFVIAWALLLEAETELKTLQFVA